MCGRFTLTVDPADLQETFPGMAIPADLTPRYNIAPTQPVAVIPNTGSNTIELYTWGLIPAWAKDPAIGNRLINARAETLPEKPAFRAAYRRRRCLIPADGFYEWQVIPGSKSKQPMYIRLKTGRPFALAGLWDCWNAPDGTQIYSCTIITTQPNALMQPIHNRMPVILPSSAYSLWLDTAERRPDELDELLQPYPAAEMMAFPVSRLVNSPHNDTAECLRPQPPQ